MEGGVDMSTIEEQLENVIEVVDKVEDIFEVSVEMVKTLLELVF
jgi:hypothetical protein